MSDTEKIRKILDETKLKVGEFPVISKVGGEIRWLGNVKNKTSAEILGLNMGIASERVSTGFLKDETPKRLFILLH